MELRTTVEDNRDTGVWGVAGLILGLLATSDLIVQAVVAILFPAVGWTLLYFWRREVTHRFPPKDPKALKEKDLDNP